MTIRFDDSIPVLFNIINSAFEKRVIENSIIMRDASGALSVVIPDSLTDEYASEISKNISDALGKYARSDRIIIHNNSFGIDNIISEAQSAQIITINGGKIRFLDRRIVGADWLLSPRNPHPSAPIIVFGSLKGGVGRSTALCVVASHLSRMGLRVLTVDLDLEAPGIGTMILKPEQLPLYGTLDYLLEVGITGIDENFLNNFYSNSYLGNIGARVAVAPAVGLSTIRNPENFLGKLARVYLEDIVSSTEPKSFAIKVREMIDNVISKNEFDVVLVDARAGLHESTAASILALGAEVLLFGIDQPQTYQGYKFMISQLASFNEGGNEDWRDRIHFVHAKATLGKSAAEEEYKSLEEFLYGVNLLNEVKSHELNEDDFVLEWDDEAIALPELDFPPIMRVFDDDRFRNFDPLKEPSQLESEAYSVAYGDLLEFANSVVAQYGMGR